MVLSNISNRNPLEQFLFYNSQFQQLQRNELISHANFLFTEEQDELQTKQEANQLQLYVELAKEIDSLAEKDSFLLYLLGKVKAKFCKDNTTIQILCRALLEGPLNWDCWTLLGSIVEDEGHFAEINKQLVFDEQFWFMPLMFRLKVMTRLQEDFGGSMSALKKLRSSGMNNFLYLDLLEGIIHYNQRDFDSAEKIFDDLIERDKFMLEAYDYLSNILYIREEQQKLAILAQQAYRIDPLRPESCCVVGNFWSLKQEHTLAIQQFQKALKLDPDYLSAWVLMGHEYLELRATSSAIECYRNALKRDKTDYRAWYGLGQTYELLKMNSYALYYYQKAARCKFNDSRMWNALSSIHFQLGDLSNALETLRKAYKLEPQDCSIGLKLSKLYLKSSKTEEAMRVYQELMKNDSFVRLGFHLLIFSGLSVLLKKYQTHCGS